MPEEYNDKVDSFDEWFHRIETFGLLEEYQQRAKQLNASTTEELIVLMKKLVEHMEIPGSLKLNNLNKLLNEGVPKINWRVDKLIPERGVIFFGGTAGSYKTWNAMDLAMCCATGKPYLNFFNVNKCKVLYIDEENGDITLPNRFNMLKKGHSLENNDLGDIDLSIFQNVKLDTSDGYKAVDDAISDNNYKLIVIDSMVRCMHGVENDATDVRNVFNNLKNIIHKHKDVAIVILHHTIKGGKGMDALRGSGDFAASADSIVMFTTKHKGFVNAEIVKNRHIDMNEFNKFSVEIINLDNGGIVFKYGEDGGFKDLSHSCADCIKDWYLGIDNGQPLIQFKTGQCKQEMARFGYKHSVVHDALNLLVQSGNIKKYKQGVFDVEQCKLVEEDD